MFGPFPGLRGHTLPRSLRRGRDAGHSYDFSVVAGGAGSGNRAQERHFSDAALVAERMEAASMKAAT